MRARIADTLEDSEFTSVYDRLRSEQAKQRLEASPRLVSPTQAQQVLIAREETAAKRADWLLDLKGKESSFEDVDVDFYLSLVEWTGQNIREDKPLVSFTNKVATGRRESQLCPVDWKSSEIAGGLDGGGHHWRRGAFIPGPPA